METHLVEGRIDLSRTIVRAYVLVHSLPHSLMFWVCCSCNDLSLVRR